MQRIVIQRVIKDKSIPADVTLKKWIKHALKNTTSAEITLRIVDKQEMTQLNKQYRGKAGPTNILSFIIEETPLMGDMVVCADVVAEEAMSQKKTLTAHWVHIITHGCLHLLGYDHVMDVGAATMEALEISLLAEQGFANPYKEND